MIQEYCLGKRWPPARLAACEPVGGGGAASSDEGAKVSARPIVGGALGRAVSQLASQLASPAPFRALMDQFGAVEAPLGHFGGAGTVCCSVRCGRTQSAADSLRQGRRAPAGQCALRPRLGLQVR